MGISTPLERPEGHAAPEVEEPDPAVALLTPFWPIDHGSSGVVTYVDNIARSLRARGGRPILLTNRSYLGADEIEDYPVRRYIPKPRPRALRALDRMAARMFPHRPGFDAIPVAIAKTIREAVQRDGVQLLEMEETYGWATGVAAAVPIPVVVRMHGPWFLTGPMVGAADDVAFHRRIALERAGLLAAAGVSTPSRNVLQLTRDYYGLPFEDAVVIPCPAPSIAREQWWRLDDADRDTILFIGRFDRVKGGDVMIDAFARLAETHPRARLCYVGPYQSLTDDAGRAWTLPEYIAAKAPRPAAEGRIEILGQTPSSRLADLRRKALVTVVPSRYDNNPNTLSEAAALGAPLVVTRVGGIPEMVEDGETALMVPGENPDALARALRRLLDDPHLAARLGRAGAERTERELSPERIAARTVDFYRSVLASHRAASSRGR